MANTLKWDDVKEKIMLATSSTRALVKAGVNGDKKFPELLANYKWAGTRDYNMALIIIAFYAYCTRSNNSDLKEFVRSSFQEGSDSDKLFDYLEDGNGKQVENYMKEPFISALDTVLKEALPDDEEKREKIIKSFIKQAGKITPWIINEPDISSIITAFCGTDSVKNERNYSKAKIVAKDRNYFTKGRMWDDPEQNSYKPTISKIWLPSFYKIFPKGRPLPSEVRQAGIGDCLLMSQLIALAKTNPKAIIDCFVQGLDKIEKEDKIDIRFFRVDTINDVYEAVPIIITVDKSHVIKWHKTKDFALWPKLIEKAYAIYAKEGFAALDGKSLSIIGGEANQWATLAITGNVPKYIDTDFDKGKPENVIDTIRRKLKKSRVLTCGFKAKFKIRDVKNNEEIEIRDKHSYAIVGINEAKKYIRLIDPNKAWGRKYSTKLINTNGPEPANEGGHIAMSFNDFKNNFSSIGYSTGKKYERF